MAETKVSTRYALSLIGIASEKNSLEEVSKDMELVLSAIKSSHELSRMLESPIVKPEKKKSVIVEIFKNKISDDSLNFISFIIEKQRGHLMQSIVEKFLMLKDEKMGIVNVEVKTSYEFTSEQKDKLKAKLEKILKKKARLKFETDNKIVGGFIAKVDDTVYDASIRHQLDLLKKEFLQGGISLN
jgi:F-type H+-transporting ATPase subunit delta